MGHELERDSSEFTPPTDEVRDWYASDVTEEEALAENDQYRCGDCNEITDEDGEGHDGLCGNCADRAQALWDLRRETIE